MRSAITRYKLRKLLKYALVTFAVAWVFNIFSGEYFEAKQLAWLLLGLWTGVLEEFLFGRRFRTLALPLQFLGKVLAINLLSLVLFLLAWKVGREHWLPVPSSGSETVAQLLSQISFYRFLVRVVVVTSIALLVVQVEELMGRRMFLSFLFGAYEKPKAEERIVLSMDLVGSTALAERLGDLRYFRFLNKTHSLMTDAVLRNEAYIHKYIGDEVIFTWRMRRGLAQQNCLDLYFDIRDRIAANESDLLREFGVVPRFRAAIHGGWVITARIGHIKRAIDFSGDVMNSVSRMLGLCKQLDADLLVSSALLARIPNVNERFKIGPEHIVPVRGRRREVRVHAAERLVKPA
ncbi:MAG: adenylate/guanylate cyclase domain-containing protein [Flavobacteriales bacterium]|nr:adenylate/guanylate cyclase domain-containing protein [Flavobacteriales bacterium]